MTQPPYQPPYQPPAPPPQKKRGCFFYGLIALVVILGIGIVAGVAGSGSDDDTGSQATSSNAPAAAGQSAPAADSDPSAKTEMDDVVVDSCIVDDTLGWPKAEITITNNSSKRSNYMISLEFVDSDNVRISEGFAAANNVAPQQKVKETAQGTGDARGKTITCRVTKVNRYMSR